MAGQSPAQGRTTRLLNACPALCPLPPPHPSPLTPPRPPVLQSDGFVQNGMVRRIPFEVMVKGDKVPVYEETLQDNGR